LGEVLRLLSKGDASYVDVARQKDVLWVRYYSTDKEKTAIYLARINLVR
jgi:hypothetical protein